MTYEETESPVTDADDRVSLCPVTHELVEQLVGLAGLDLTDEAAVEGRLREWGWRDHGEAVTGPEYADVPDTPDADHVSPLGHFVHCDGDGSFHMPFAYLYDIGGGLLDEDLWAVTPGWSSQEGAERPEFDAHFDTVMHRFIDRLGLPDYDVRQPKYADRIVAWRLAGNVLIVGQGKEPMSYHQFEDAHVFIGSLTAENVEFPGGAAIRALVTS